MKTIYLLFASLLLIGSIYSQVKEEDAEETYNLSLNWDQGEYIISNSVRGTTLKTYYVNQKSFYCKYLYGIKQT